MRNARALRETRRSAARGMHLVAIAGIALTLFVTATAIFLTHPGATGTRSAAENTGVSQFKS